MLLHAFPIIIDTACFIVHGSSLSKLLPQTCLGVKANACFPPRIVLVLLK